MDHVASWPDMPLPRWVDATADRVVQARARDTRRALLLAASCVIDQHGYTGAHLSEIAERYGGTKGALYFHFDSKHELAETLVTEVIASWDDLFVRIVALDLDPLRTVLMCHDAYTGRLMYDVSARAALRIVSEQIGRHHAERWAAHWAKTLHGLLVGAQVAGLLSPTVDPTWLAEHLLAVTQGQFHLAERKSAGPTMWERMDSTWTGLLPTVTTEAGLTAWHESGWRDRPPPAREHYRALGLAPRS